MGARRGVPVGGGWHQVLAEQGRGALLVPEGVVAQTGRLVRQEAVWLGGVEHHGRVAHHVQQERIKVALVVHLAQHTRTVHGEGVH